MARFLFPARAGVIPALGFTKFSLIAFPRACGGDPPPIALSKVEYPFSPRVRG